MTLNFGILKMFNLNVMMIYHFNQESIEQQISSPPRPTFDGFAIGTNERDVSLGDTIFAQLDTPMLLLLNI